MPGSRPAGQRDGSHNRCKSGAARDQTSANRLFQRGELTAAGLQMLEHSRHGEIGPNAGIWSRKVDFAIPVRDLPSLIDRWCRPSLCLSRSRLTAFERFENRPQLGMDQRL